MFQILTARAFVVNAPTNDSFFKQEAKHSYAFFPARYPVVQHNWSEYPPEGRFT